MTQIHFQLYAVRREFDRSEAAEFVLYGADQTDQAEDKSSNGNDFNLV